jgi:hypothetical protein
MKKSQNKAKENNCNEYNPEWKALNPDYLWQLPNNLEEYNIPETVDMECWRGEEK